MAVYEYRCSRCGHEEEIQKPMTEWDREEKCPECENVMDRIIGKTSFALKGQGWYATDYKEKK